MNIKKIAKFLSLGLVTLALGAGTALACEGHGDQSKNCEGKNCGHKHGEAKAEGEKGEAAKDAVKGDEAPKQVAKADGKKAKSKVKK